MRPPSNMTAGTPLTAERYGMRPFTATAAKSALEVALKAPVDARLSQFRVELSKSAATKLMTSPRDRKRVDCAAAVASCGRGGWGRAQRRGGVGQSAAVTPAQATRGSGPPRRTVPYAHAHRVRHAAAAPTAERRRGARCARPPAPKRYARMLSSSWCAAPRHRRRPVTSRPSPAPAPLRPASGCAPISNPPARTSAAATAAFMTSGSRADRPPHAQTSTSR